MVESTDNDERGEYSTMSDDAQWRVSQCLRIGCKLIKMRCTSCDDNHYQGIKNVLLKFRASWLRIKITLTVQNINKPHKELNVDANLK